MVVANAADVPEGKIRLVIVEGRKVALYHTSGGFFATENSCPHRGGPLSEGDLLGNEVVCPWHLWNFNVTNGTTDIDCDVTLITHEVRVEDGRVFIRLSPERPLLPELL